jgi:hypothetical protein
VVKKGARQLCKAPQFFPCEMFRSPDSIVIFAEGTNPNGGGCIPTTCSPIVGFAPDPIVLMSLRPAVPWRVGLHQSPPPLHQPVSFSTSRLKL